MRPIVWCVDTPAGRVVIGGDAEAQPKRWEAGRPTGWCWLCSSGVCPFVRFCGKADSGKTVDWLGWSASV